MKSLRTLLRLYAIRCYNLAANYNLSAPFRPGITARKLTRAVGILRYLDAHPLAVNSSG